MTKLSEHSNLQIHPHNLNFVGIPLDTKNGEQLRVVYPSKKYFLLHFYKLNDLSYLQTLR